MPARLFRVHLINDTGFSLRRIPGHSLQGEFTSGEWTPPDTIPANQERGWQSESDGVLQGTEGWETYEVMDGSPVPDQVRLHWDNPYWGRATAHLDLLQSTGMFEDRQPAPHADASENELEHSQSPRFKLEGLGPRPMGSYPGAINTDGWLEIAPGFLALPIPLGTVDHAWTAYRLTERSRSDSDFQFGERAHAQGLVFVPSINTPSDAWEGTFVYPSGEASSAQVFLQIQKRAKDSRFVMTSLRGVSFQVTLVEKTGLKQTSPISINEGPVFETQTEDLAYHSDLWPPRAPYQGGGILEKPGAVLSGLTAAGAAGAVGASGFNGSFLSTTGDLTTTLSRATQLGNGSSAGGGPAGGSGQPGGGGNGPMQVKGSLSIAQHLAQQGMRIKVADAADSLSLPFNITLMLYSVHFENGQPLGYSARYVRRNESGARIADVMLLPALASIR